MGKYAEFVQSEQAAWKPIGCMTFTYFKCSMKEFVLISNKKKKELMQPLGQNWE